MLILNFFSYTLTSLTQNPNSILGFKCKRCCLNHEIAKKRCSSTGIF